jgi:membrane-associated protease RseP (regulator of RpoE activity)
VLHSASQYLPIAVAVLVLLLYFQVLAILNRVAQFCAARILGMPVIKMTIGSGKRIRLTRLGEVYLEWRLLPLGCRLQFLGEPGNCDIPAQIIQDDPAISPAKKLLLQDPKRTWDAVSCFKRLLTISAGPLACVMVALIFWGQFIRSESDYSLIPFTYIAGLEPGSSAEHNGFRQGDFIVFVRGNETSPADRPVVIRPSAAFKNNSKVTTFVFRRSRKDGEPLCFTRTVRQPLDELRGARVIRGNLDSLQFPLPRKYTSRTAGLANRAFDPRYVSADGSVRHGIRSYLLVFFDGLAALADGRGYRYGALSFYTLFFTACLLLPLPGLEGPRLLRTGYEFILRRPPSERMLKVLCAVILIALIGTAFLP